MSRFYLISFVCSFLLILSLTNVHAQEKPEEAKLKTMYMMNFAKYTMWPKESMEDKFYIGVLNDDLMVEQLEAVAKRKKVQELEVEIVSFQDPANIGDFHMIYLGEEMNEISHEVREQIGDRPILLITSEDATGSGNINYILDKNHYKYELYKEHYTNSGLRCSDVLENLAHRVIE